MRQFGQEVVDGPQFGLSGFVVVYAILGLITGLIFGAVDFLLPRSFLKRTSFGKALLLRTATYFAIFILITAAGVTTFTYFDKNEIALSDFVNFFFSSEMLLVFLYFFSVVFLIHFVKEVDRKFGPGNLLRMLRGSFHKPKEVERVFMFLDLKSSTTIAEQIGHLKYSQLIQDCFSDLEIVFKYKAEVYQYVGDEAVLTWTMQNGTAGSNAIKAFFSFKHQIQKRAEYYQKNYDLVPEFKAGLNAGRIVVAEVGEEKREIAYHGDTINTAARIQSECAIQGEEILISKNLYELVVSDNQFTFSPKGEVQLKGKSIKTEIFSIREMAN